VDQYAWSTSPLRRYTDLVNQWQILACIEHGVTAPLVAPFKPRDADLFAIVSGFDAAYSGYADFQSTMERYWCLRWLAQENARTVEAVVLKDEILRLVDIPLVLRMPGLPQLARGLQVKLDLLRWDEVDLTVEARLLEVPAAAAQALASDLGEDDDELLEGMASMGSEEQGEEAAAEQNSVQNNVQNDAQDSVQENAQEEPHPDAADADENPSAQAAQ